MRKLVWNLAGCMVVVVLACGGGADPDGGADAGMGGTAGTGGAVAVGGTVGMGGSSVMGGASGTGGAMGTSPIIAGCSILPPNHIFNTAIDGLPVHPSSAAFMATIGNHNLHLDLGQQETTTADDYYGIPYNVIDASTFTWANVAFSSTDPNLDWDPRPESDCASGTGHTIVSPCTAALAPMPQLPIPAMPLVEGGVFPDATTSPYGDHHILLLDRKTCRLWEIYHAYRGAGAVWNIFGAATFDLGSNALRPLEWTSADAAGFPILPLLLRADEASGGTIRHALRFTIPSGSIRAEYVWPARHLTGRAGSAGLPPMGQLFRLKASYTIPANFNAQSKAILQALKTYGMYLADGGSAMYIQGEPNATWSSAIFREVQSVSSSQFEAVDIAAVTKRVGFDPNSAAVPPQ